MDPDDTLQFGSEDKPRSKEALSAGVDVIAEPQDKLYAQDRWGALADRLFVASGFSRT